MKPVTIGEKLSQNKAKKEETTKELQAQSAERAKVDEAQSKEEKDLED